MNTLSEDDLQARAHGVAVMESARRDHLPVPLAVIKRIIDAAKPATGRPIVRKGAKRSNGR